MRLIILGAPGAGKGTQAAIISQKISIPHISTGEIFRDNIKNETELGILAKLYIDKGQLVPDKITIRIIKNRIEQPDCNKGFILDGFPRTVVQADALETSIYKMHHSINKVLYIDVPDEIIIKRMMGRRVCPDCGETFHLIHKPPVNHEKCDVCGGILKRREDDSEDTIRNRLAVYHKQTEPLINYYKEKGLLTVVKGAENIKITSNMVFTALEICTTNTIKV